MSRTYLDVIYRLGRNIGGNDYPDIRLVIGSGLDNRKSAFKGFNGNNQATSCPNLVNFCRIISQFTLLKRSIFAAIRPQFDDYLHSSRWRFQTDCKIAILISAE